MKILLLYDYPPSPGGLATQGDLMYRGLRELGIDAHAVNLESALEKEWYYRWMDPDVVLGVGYWGHSDHIILHPQRFGMTAVPWLVVNGYLGTYLEILNRLPLILVTSNWVKQVYARDGVEECRLEVLPVGCDTDGFTPIARDDPRVLAVREALGVSKDEIMILTVGGDAASKGAQEVMQALALIGNRSLPWKYVCKVWPQNRTDVQNQADLQLASSLGIDRNVVYSTGKISREFMPYLLNACDIYAAPSRLEGFGMTQVEANACGKPVIGIRAMGMLDTMIHNQTALLAGVAQEVRIRETILTEDHGCADPHRVVFRRPRTADYRASVHDIATFLLRLMNDSQLRSRMGSAGRERAIENFHYRTVARRLVEILPGYLEVAREQYQPACAG